MRRAWKCDVKTCFNKSFRILVENFAIHEPSAVYVTSKICKPSWDIQSLVGGCRLFPIYFRSCLLPMGHCKMLVRTDVDLMLMQSIASCIVESSLLVQHQCRH